MRTVKLIVLVLLVLMSLAAGASKVMQMPQELAFFENVGVSTSLVLPLGLIQIAAAVLAIIPKTRKIGLYVMALAFFASAVMIFLSKQLGFGFISLIPAAVAGGLAEHGWTSHETL